MIHRKTQFSVVVEGKIVPVTQSETGRLYATIQDDSSTQRQWNAMDLETLNARIKATTD